MVTECATTGIRKVSVDGRAPPPGATSGLWPSAHLFCRGIWCPIASFVKQTSQRADRVSDVSRCLPAPDVGTSVSAMRRRRFLTDDLLIGAGLVTFFVLLGITLTAVSIRPTPSQRWLALLVGEALGFAMLLGALRVAQFRADGSDRSVTVIEQPRRPVDGGREFRVAGEVSPVSELRRAAPTIVTTETAADPHRR
jgi:hypothetical protein